MPVSFWALLQMWGSPRALCPQGVGGDSLEDPPSLFLALHPDTACCSGPLKDLSTLAGQLTCLV